MRDIRFREYRGDGRWHYWGLMDECKFVGPCSPNSIAQQFTGHKDDLGNEIWEGDIIEFDCEEMGKDSGVVRFSEHGH